MSNISEYPIFVIQHTSGEFLGLMEDHLEGRGIPGVERIGIGS